MIDFVIGYAHSFVTGDIKQVLIPQGFLYRKTLSY